MNAVGDYSLSPVCLTMPSRGFIRICNFSIIACFEGDIDSFSYGAPLTPGPLTNGIMAYVIDQKGNIKYDLTQQLKIKSLMDWVGLCGTTHKECKLNDGYTHFVAEITSDQFGEPIRILSSAGENLCVVLNDDFSHLTKHLFHVYGYNEKSNN
jgi:hypothetical protein